MPRFEVVAEGPFALGESPIWDPREGRLYWVDSIGCRIHAMAPKSGELQSWDLPDRVGSIGLRAAGGFIAALRSGFGFFDPVDGTFTAAVDPEPDIETNRLNDGKCDARGRYWCGSMNEALKLPTGSLYRLDPDLTCTRMEKDIIVSNGTAWSPDWSTMYFADSRREIVYAYDFDLDRGTIANRRTFIDFKGSAGRTDGATVDSNGNYWCALVHGWTVGCFSPAGQPITEIRLPVRHPTMCCFGGDDLDVLYVTSTTTLFAPGEGSDQPLAGALFAISGTGAHGRPEPMFAG